MEERVYDSMDRFLGTIQKEWNDKYYFYGERKEQLGYYDERRNETYDSYGHLVGEGNRLSELPYIPRKLRFPLPSLDEVSFTTYRIEKESDHSGNRGRFSQYWDDGQCEVCGKSSRPTCRVQGLPGMCKTCYRFFQIYSRTDTFGLENKSRYHAITVREIRKTVEAAKAPFIAAEKAADAAAKAALMQIPREILHSAAENNTNSVARSNQVAAKPTPKTQGSVNKTTGNVRRGKKKKHLYWYHWIIIAIVLYYGSQLLIVLLYWLYTR